MFASLSRRTPVRWALWNAGLLRPATQTTAAERACIARHATGRKRLVEIGVFNGMTTLEIRKVMAPDAILWAVDPFPKGKLGFCLDERIARHTIGRSENGSVEFVLMTGTEAARRHRDTNLLAVDFIFIDGDHSWSGIEADWTGWLPLVAPGGVIALHDSRSYPGRVVTHDSARYTAEVVRLDPRVEVIDEVDTITVLRVRNAQPA